MFGNLFRKRVPIFKKRDRETWKQIRAALKEEGLKGARYGHYLQETVMGGGWEILRRRGIVPVVEENVLLDAALRKKPADDVVRL